MLPEIALEALGYLDRAALEGLQIHSRYLRDLVNCHARSLPLRYILNVDIIHGNPRFRLTEDQGFQRFEVLEPGEQKLEALFHRVNNAFIRELTLTFRLEDLPLLHYLRENAHELQCQITALCILGTEMQVDYALTDFLGLYFTPQVYKTSISYAFREDYAMLFTRNALRGSVTHLTYDICVRAVPDCIVAELFGDGVVQTCDITTHVDPLAWIGTFIETFEMAEPGTDSVRSVTLLHVSWRRGSPLLPSGAPLGQPHRTDVPTPHSRLIKEWSREAYLHDGTTTTEASVAELYEFENAKSTKMLQVFKWTLEQKYEEVPLTALHYAFLLQVVDM